MGYHTTPAQLAKRQRQRFQSVIGDQVEAHKIIATSGKRDFLALTSGRISSDTLAKMGHPFGKGSPVAGAQRGVKPGSFLKSGKKGQVTRKGLVRRLPINRQSNRLRRAIQLHYRGGRLHLYELYSDAPHAKYVLHPRGTDLMVPRGLLGPDGELRKRHKARVQTYIDVVRKAQRKP